MENAVRGGIVKTQKRPNLEMESTPEFTQYVQSWWCVLEVFGLMGGVPGSSHLLFS